MVDLRGQLPIRDGRLYYQRDLAGITGVTLHYTASPCRSGIDAVRAIAEYQISEQIFDAAGDRIGGPQEAFPGIAYTLMVDCEGTIYQCWDLSVRCWHNGAVVNGIARNASHVGVCFLGDDEPTADQLAGLLGAIAWTGKELGRQLAIEGHKDSFNTHCPGASWPTWRPFILP